MVTSECEDFTDLAKPPDSNELQRTIYIFNTHLYHVLYHDGHASGACLEGRGLQPADQVGEQRMVAGRYLTASHFDVTGSFEEKNLSVLIRCQPRL